MSEESKQSEPKVIRFDYLKSNLFRVIHADGVVGSVNPNGHLVFSLFNERTPIPQQVVHEVELDDISRTATLGDEVRAQRVTRDAIVREVEIGVVMDFRTAASFHKWLGGQLETMKTVETLRRKEPL